MKSLSVFILAHPSTHITDMEICKPKLDRFWTILTQVGCQRPDKCPVTCHLILPRLALVHVYPHGKSLGDLLLDTLVLSPPHHTVCIFPLAGIRSPAFLALSAQSQADWLFITQSEIIGEHPLDNIDTGDNHDNASGCTVTRSLGSEISICIYSAQDQPPRV